MKRRASGLVGGRREVVAAERFCQRSDVARAGERDQLALAYVLLRMGLTREGGKSAPAVRLLPRSMHYLQKPSLRELHMEHGVEWPLA